MQKTQEVSNFIEQVYDAALNPSHWDIALNQFCQIFEAEAAYLSSQHSYLTADNNGAPTEVLDPTPSDAKNFNPSTQLTRNHLIHSTALHPQNGASIFFTLKRNKERGALNPQQIEIFTYCAKHIERALHIGEQLGLQNAHIAAAEGVYNQQYFGIILLNNLGQVIFASQQALAIADHSGAFCINQNGLRASRWPDQQALAHTLSFAINATVTQNQLLYKPLSVSCANGSPPITLLICSVKRHSNLLHHNHPAAFIIIGDSQSTPDIEATTLRNLFDLTKTEIKLTLELIKGSSLDEAAAHLGITKNTAKVHLRHIFRKTQTKRQSELVQRVLSIAHI